MLMAPKGLFFCRTFRKRSDFYFIDVNYRVIVVTGESGIDANAVLCIFGEKDTTANLPLRTTKDGSPAKFHQDSTLEFDIKAEDVGKVKSTFVEIVSKDIRVFS